MNPTGDTPRTIADEMLAAHRRRMLDMPTAIIIPRSPDRSRNSQRTATRRPTRRTL